MFRKKTLVKQCENLQMRCSDITTNQQVGKAHTQKYSLLRREVYHVYASLETMRIAPVHSNKCTLLLQPLLPQPLLSIFPEMHPTPKFSLFCLHCFFHTPPRPTNFWSVWTNPSQALHKRTLKYYRNLRFADPGFPKLTLPPTNGAPKAPWEPQEAAAPFRT